MTQRRHNDDEHKSHLSQEPATRAQKMDEYQEELLEYQAYEMDPLEPAEDATEL